MIKEISKKELEGLYRKHTNLKVCEILGVSKVTLIKMIDDSGIEKKGKGNARKYLVT